LACSPKRNIAQKILSVDDWYAILTMLSVTEILIIRCIFQLKFHQIRFRPGLRESRWHLTTFSRPPSWLGRGTLALPPLPSTPSESRFPMGPRRCAVRMAHQIVNPALYACRMLQHLLGSDGSCDNNWHYYSDTDSCFNASSNRENFTDARTWCKTNGGDLASIKDQDEMNFIRSILSWVILIYTSFRLEFYLSLFLFVKRHR